MVITDSNMKSLTENVGLHLFKLMGLICVKNTLNGPIFLYKPFVLGIIVVCLTMPSIVYGLMLEMKSPYSKGMPTATAVVVTFIHYGTIVSTSIVIVVFAAWNYEKIGKVYSCIEIIENKLNIEKRCMKIYQIFFFSIIAMIMISIWHFWACLQINKINVWYIPAYISEVLFIVFILQLTLITNRIKTLFLVLNAELLKTLQPYGKQCMPKTVSAAEALPASALFVLETKSLKSLCDLHWDICETIDSFNMAFKTQLQFHFFNIFIQLIDMPYFIFLASRESIFLDPNLQYILTSLVWTVLHAAQMFAIVLTCGVATKTGNETSFILCKHLQSGISKPIKRNIKSFLTLLEVHRTDFHCGIFSLNESVISAVTGSVTTYLVILIQFQNQDLHS